MNYWPRTTTCLASPRLRRSGAAGLVFGLLGCAPPQAESAAPRATLDDAAGPSESTAPAGGSAPPEGPTPSPTPSTSPEPTASASSSTDGARAAAASPSANAAEAAAPGLDVPIPTYRVATGASPPVRDFVLAQRDAARPGALWAGPLDGNGGRDVVIYVPPTVDPEAPVRVVFHFHGTYSEHLQPEAPGVKKKRWVGWNRLEQTLDAADALAERREANVAVIYPLSAGRRIEPEWVGWANKQYDRLWMKAEGESFAALHADAVSILSSHLGVPAAALRAGVVVEGHSAGGIALWHVAAGGKARGADLVDEFLFLDAGFQDWADGCFDAIEAHDLGARITLVITDGGIADPWRGRTPWCKEAPEHARVWPDVQAQCEPLLATRPNTKPAGSDVSCRQLAADAEHWPRQQRWCAAMKDDMRSVPDVFVHRTEVPHGQQIAHFLGGLELPAAWWR